MNGIDKIALLSSADLTSAEVALRQIPNDDPNGCFYKDVLDSVRAGKYQLIEIKVSNERVGFTVYFIETFGEHKEFVSVATWGSAKSTLRFDLEKMFCALAKNLGCQTLRMHTVRHGLVRDALQAGWHVAEIVLRKNLT